MWTQEVDIVYGDFCRFYRRHPMFLFAMLSRDIAQLKAPMRRSNAESGKQNQMDSIGS